MKTITIAYYTILRNFRDTKSLASTLLLPIILILILGNALGNAFDIKNIDKTNIAFLNQDVGQYSKEFEKFLGIDDINELLNIKTVSSYDEGITDVKSGKISAFIMINSNYSDLIQKGEKGIITVFSDTENSFEATLVKSIVDSFISEANTYSAAYKLGNINPSFDQKEMIRKMPVSAKGKIPGAMDYYSVTMLVMTLIYGSLYGLHGFAEDYIDNMRIRLGCTPVKLSSHFAGKIIGLMITVFAQGLVLILFTKYVYGTNWGNNPFLIIFITVSLAIFTVTAGVMTAILVRNRNAASAMLSTVIPVMTFISGGYAKIVSDDKAYNAIKLLMPSNLGQTAFFNTIYGDSITQTLSSLTILWVITAIFGIVALLAGRRKFV